LLVERVPGTPSHAKAKDHIVNSLNEIGGWTIELDSFEESTPMGKKPFANIVATRHPAARKRLVLAAHYDSKWFETGAFIGATDSAAPCAILLELAATLKPALDAIRTPPDTSLQLIFFDGEEAWLQWSDTDSLYGSRHLAQKWERERLPSNPEVTVLQSISAFVLLDLLGAPQTTVYNLQRSTASHFSRLAYWDEQLRTTRFNLFRIGSSGSSTNSVNRYFHPEVDKQPFINYQIEDDHVPFMRRGVPIVHLIPAEFPRVWHTLADDGSALDKDTI
ncbi:putative glutaminyl-peptide cyclotransferase, partial [Catenaria anguillulae PL171]